MVCTSKLAIVLSDVILNSCLNKAIPSRGARHGKHRVLDLIMQPIVRLSRYIQHRRPCDFCWLGSERTATLGKAAGDVGGRQATVAGSWAVRIACPQAINPCRHPTVSMGRTDSSFFVHAVVAIANLHPTNTRAFHGRRNKPRIHFPHSSTRKCSGPRPTTALDTYVGSSYCIAFRE